MKHYYFDNPVKRILARGIDWAGYTLSRPRQNFPVKDGTIKKILLIRLDHIGDVLMTTPAIRALRKKFPAAEIHLLVREATAPAVAGNPYIDRIITLNAPWTTPGPKKASRGDVRKLTGRLKAEGYDCVVGFRADLREALLIGKTAAPVRIGFGARGGGFSLTHPAEFEPDAHEIIRALGLLVPLGVPADGEEMDFFLSEAERKKGAEILNTVLAENGRKLVGIHPGAASSLKRWSDSGFARLADLLSQSGFRVILLGAESDRELLERIRRMMTASIPVVSDIGLRILGAVIDKLDLLVGNDSAPVHLARAVGTPSLTLFGPTHEEITGPLDREKHAVIRSPVGCSPCWRPGTKFRCRFDQRCWEELEAEEVAAAAVRLISDNCAP